MIQIPRRPRSDIPTAKGWYLIHEAGVDYPQLVRWSGLEKRWTYAKSAGTIPVEGWVGPIVGVPDDLAGIR